LTLCGKGRCTEQGVERDWRLGSSEMAWQSCQSGAHGAKMSGGVFGNG